MHHSPNNPFGGSGSSSATVVKLQLAKSFVAAFDSGAASARAALGPLVESLDLFFELAPVPFEDVADMAVSLCRCVGDGSAEDAADPRWVEAVALCGRQLRKAYRSHRNPRKIFGLACSKLVPACAAAESAADSATAAAVWPSITAHVLAILTSSEHVPFYRGAMAMHHPSPHGDGPAAMSSPTTAEGRDARSYPRLAFDALRQLAESGGALRRFALRTAPRLFDLFVANSGGVFGRTEGQVRFSVLEAVAAAVGFDPVTAQSAMDVASSEGGTEEGGSSENQSSKRSKKTKKRKSESVADGDSRTSGCDADLLRCANAFLDVVHDRRVYNETEDTASGGFMLRWFQAAAGVFIACVTDASDSDHRDLSFEGLTRLVRLNHTATEAVVPAALRLVWGKGETPPESMELFVCAVVGTYSRLRQLDTFVQLAAEAAKPIPLRRSAFSDVALTAFAKAIAELPEGQTTLVAGVIFDAVIQVAVPTASDVAEASDGRATKGMCPHTSPSPLTLPPSPPPPPLGHYV